MLAFTLFALAGGFASPPAGWLVDRFGGRKVVLVCALASGALFCLLALVNDLWLFLAIWAVNGAVMAGTGSVPTSAMVTHWFVRRRGLAIGIMAAGVGVGGLVFVPLVNSWLMPAFGWRATFIALGVLTWLVLAPLAAFVMKDRPSEMGLNPDGAEGGALNYPVEKPPSHGNLPLRQAMATAPFWLIAAGFLFGGFSQAGMMQHQAPYLGDAQVDPSLVSGALGAVGLFSMIGKIFFGWLSQRINPKYSWAIAVTLQAAAAVTLLNVSAGGHPELIWLFAVLLGLGVGGWLPAMSLLISSGFGLASYGAIFGVISLVFGVGQALGPLTAGYLYDGTGSYRLAIFIFLGCYAATALAMLLIRSRRRAESAG
jgi:MFS family permease